MTTITTKYSEGDVVYFATTVMEKKQHDCPDCLGARKWTTTSPAGTEYSFPCPRCVASYASNTDASLGYSLNAPRAERRTIGSVQFNSAPGTYNEGASYMCTETGIGSGSVYPEAKLFQTESEALREATIEAQKLNSTTPHIVKKFSESLKISDYQLSNAQTVRAANERYHASSALYNLNELRDNIIDVATSLEEAQDFFAEYMAREWEKDKASVAT